jgi:hypothetical protein
VTRAWACGVWCVLKAPSAMTALTPFSNLYPLSKLDISLLSLYPPIQNHSARHATMPRSPAAKPKQFKPSKPTTYSRLPAKSSKHDAKPTPPPSSSTTPPALTLDKHLVLQIILAKLESSKSCDWHELSLKLSGTSGYAKEGAKGGKKGAIKAKAREKKDVAAQGLSGTELREMYHDVGRWTFQNTSERCS